MLCPDCQHRLATDGSCVWCIVQENNEDDEPWEQYEEDRENKRS